MIHINVDKDLYVPASLQTGGAMYSPSTQSYSELDPPLNCPNCGMPAIGFACVSSLYEAKEKNGKVYVLKPCPVKCTIYPWLYTLEPCSCRVSQDWAAAFTAEMTSRVKGNNPRKLSLMPDSVRERRREDFQKALTELYKMQAVVTDEEQKENIDRWCVIIVDQICRMCPGAHNQMLPKPLGDKVKAWANANDLANVWYTLAEKKDELTADFESFGPKPKGLGAALSDSTDATLGGPYSMSAYGVTADSIKGWPCPVPVTAPPQSLPPVPNEPVMVALIPPVEKHTRKKRTIRRITE